MRRSARAILPATLALGLSLGACAPYTAVSGQQSLSEQGLEVSAPPGWYRANRAPDMYLITRDGQLLQYISLQRVAVADDLKFTKRKFDAAMPPSEVAEVELDEMRSNPAVLNLTVEENVPVTVDGRAGFRLVCAWNSKDGLRLKRVHYGFRDGKYVYRITYQAAARYYFDRDLPVFETVRQSLHVLARPA